TVSVLVLSDGRRTVSGVVLMVICVGRLTTMSPFSVRLQPPIARTPTTAAKTRACILLPLEGIGPCGHKGNERAINGRRAAGDGRGPVVCRRPPLAFHRSRSVRENLALQPSHASQLVHLGHLATEDEDECG